MWKDLQYAWRLLRRNPGFTAVALVSVALGIGANTAMFSVLDAILLRPPAYRDPEQLIVIQRLNQKGAVMEQISAPDWRDLSERSRTLESLAAYRTGTVAVSGAGEPERMRVSAISANLPAVLGVSPLIGRPFRPEDMQPEAPLPVLISESLWRERFAGRSDITDVSLTFDGVIARITGVMPASFAFPSPSTRLWVPLRIAPNARRSVYSLKTVARLKPGFSLESARQDLAAQMAQIARANPDTSTGVSATALSLQEYLAGNSRGLLLVSAGAVGFILLIVCANLAGLLLARASGRTSEFAVRSAVGAGRWRLLRQLLAEGMLLSAIGGAVGVLASSWAVDGLRLLVKDRFIRAPEIHLNGTVLLFALAATALCGIAFGMAPALTAMRGSLAPGLNRNTRRGASGRACLVTIEVAIAFVLLAGAGLMTQTLWRLRAVDPGFSAGDTLAVSHSPNLAQLRSVEQIAAFYENLLASIRSIPGVRAAGAIGHVPLTGEKAGTGITVENRPAEPGRGIEANYQLAGPQYFAAMRIPFLEGRDFNQSDAKGAPEVVIINRALAELCWPGQSAIGRRIRLGPNPKAPWATVVGVIGNVRHDQLSLPTRPEAYESYFQHGWGDMSLVIHRAADATDIAPAIRAKVRQADTRMPLPAIVSMDDIVSTSLRDRSFLMWILLGFAACATVLAAIGIYGVIAYSVAQRTREIGIRMALGAQARDVTRMVLSGGLRMAVVGVFAGGLAAVGVTRLLQTLLFGVEPGDPVTLLAAAGLLVVVATAACVLPTIRAARIAVSAALRHE